MTEDVDHVALERAARGDVEVWKNLTRHERDLALIAARKRRLAELEERGVWTDIFRRHCYGHTGGESNPYPMATPDWMVDIARAAGFKDPATVMKQGRLAELRLGG